MNQTENELLASIQENFSLAETRLKNYEDKFGEGPVIPTINELRYAGNHLIKALFAADESSKLEQLHLSNRHTKRATYDACAAAIAECFYRITTFQEEYASHHSHVLAVIPDYSKHQKVLRQARDLIKNVRFGNGEKEDYYKKVDSLLPGIIDYVEQLYDQYIPEIDLLVSAERSKNAKETERHTTAIVISVISAIAAVLALGVSLMPLWLPKG